ncbi:hypothetical protein KPL78_16170 [Roseomonas sp. HJA6]|uniref:Uncharacterized protein n=1 Tax=Roseomonas alba TaxID=2846776 RepID=A0ABS7ADZ7_9PROT|nr:hypothetical protein [Neoroseomonas alba]
MPTFAEAGVPGFVLRNSISLFAPQGTERETIAPLKHAFLALMNGPEMKA